MGSFYAGGRRRYPGFLLKLGQLKEMTDGGGSMTGHCEHMTTGENYYYHPYPPNAPPLISSPKGNGQYSNEMFDVKNSVCNSWSWCTICLSKLFRPRITCYNTNTIHWKTATTKFGWWKLVQQVPLPAFNDKEQWNIHACRTGRGRDAWSLSCGLSVIPHVCQNPRDVSYLWRAFGELQFWTVKSIHENPTRQAGGRKI